MPVGEASSLKRFMRCPTAEPFQRPAGDPAAGAGSIRQNIHPLPIRFYEPSAGRKFASILEWCVYWAKPHSQPARGFPVDKGTGAGTVLGEDGSFAGPGSLVAVGYIDPGNWATDIAGGARYGYALLSVIVLANLLAMFLQTLALRLGIATGRDLAQLCRERFSRPTALLLWIGCELAIMACDLAEIIGSAIGLQLLFALPLIVGVCATALDVGVVLWLQSRAFRYIEALVIALLVVVGACLAFELIMAQPDFKGNRRFPAAFRTDRQRSRHVVHRDRHPRRNRDAA